MRGAKPYVADAIHYQGEVVTHMGATFQARSDTGRAPPHEDWICIASAGRDARSPTIRTTYSATERYSFLDIVALGGSSFIARRDNPGECPGPGWQLVASAGKPGRQGPKGDAGARGERGLAGDPAPLIVGWKIDATAYTVTPIMSDDSPAPPIDLHPLFEQFHGEAR
jgi:hypothetical protein